MKAITTLIGLVFMASLALASSTLNLTIHGGVSYTVYLDGQQYQTTSTIRFQGLFPGRHTLSVIKNEVNSTSIFNGYIDIEDNKEVFGTVANGTLTVTSQHIASGSPQYDYDHSNYEYRPHGNQNRYGMSQSVFNQLFHDFTLATDSKKARLLIQKAQRYGITALQAKQLLGEFAIDTHRLGAAKQITVYVVDRENYWMAGETFIFLSNKNSFLSHLNESAYNQGNNYPNGHHYPNPRPPYPTNYGMNEQAFELLKRNLINESFDENKKKQIMTAVTNGSVSTQQMTTLLKEFTFDGKRLEVAKAVIPYVIDRENYWMVGETFTFSSNKNNFLEALN